MSRFQPRSSRRDHPSEDPAPERERASRFGPSQLFSIKVAAERLGISARTVRRLIDSRELPTHRIGRAIRISQDDLERFVRAARR